MYPILPTTRRSSLLLLVIDVKFLCRDSED